jgi:glycerophosphoryl diester phosphodiesterase
MKRKRWIGFASVLLISWLVLAFGVGGGFGKKAQTHHIWISCPSPTSPTVQGMPCCPRTAPKVSRAASLQGYAGVEIDIHATRDGVFILFHDDSCQRMLGIEGTVAEHTFAELKDIPLRNHSVPTELRIARLDSVLARYGDSLLFYLDIKLTGRDQAERIAQLVERHAPKENILIASSSIPFLLSLEYGHPEINTVLEGFDKGEEWTWWLFPKKFRPDFVSSFAFETDNAQVAWLRKQSLLANKIVYGVDSAQHARMTGLGISRFIVDEGLQVVSH